MPRRLIRSLPLVALCVGLMAPPAAAQIPTTPIPPPADPSQPPASDPNPPPTPRPVVADAGTGLAVVRLLPNSVPGDSTLPDLEVPPQAAGEVGIGLAVAQANSEAYLAYERAIAEASPLGVAIAGKAPRLPIPGSLTQAAVPDNPEPATSALDLPSTPLDAALTVGGLKGQVHARWSETQGPCVDPIATAETTLGSLSAVNVIPSLPATRDLTQLLALPGTGNTSTSTDAPQQLAAPLHQLGGLLSGQARANGPGSLLRVPELAAAVSEVRLVDEPGLPGKAVRATSTVRLARIQLLAGTPQEVNIEVVSPPQLVATATGDPATSRVEYTAPVLRVVQGGREIARLDAANPTVDLPLGLPLGRNGLGQVPLGGDLLGDGSLIPADLRRIDIGVLRLHIGQFTKKQEGSVIGGVARLLDLQLLPTDALRVPGLPPALAQVVIGEQVVRAAAPAGGVDCSTSAATPAPPSTTPDAQQPVAAGPDDPRPQAGVPPLAYTNAAYHAVPLLWTGVALLLAGSVLIAATPRPRPDRPRDRAR